MDWNHQTLLGERTFYSSIQRSPPLKKVLGRRFTPVAPTPTPYLEKCHKTLKNNFHIAMLSFPARARSESARAVTGRRCPHSGEAEDFLMGQLNFFTKTAVTPEQKVEKSIPRWEINRHAEG